jgi:hypothetical protein
LWECLLAERIQLLQDRNGERSCLSRSSACLANDVVAFQCFGDQRRLDGAGFFVARLGQSRQHDAAKMHLGKRFGSVGFHKYYRGPSCLFERSVHDGLMEGRAQETRPCQLDDPQDHRLRATHWEVPDEADRAKDDSFRSDAAGLHLCRESFDVTICRA